MKIDCQYWERTRDRGAAKCLLGWRGGRVFPQNCLDCLKSGENTPEAYQSAQEKWAKTHPEPFRGGSGCCDSAKNYPKEA